MEFLKNLFLAIFFIGLAIAILLSYIYYGYMIFMWDPIAGTLYAILFLSHIPAVRNMFN